MMRVKILVHCTVLCDCGQVRDNLRTLVGRSHILKRNYELNHAGGRRWQNACIILLYMRVICWTATSESLSLLSCIGAPSPQAPAQERLRRQTYDVPHIYITVHDHEVGIPRQQQSSLFKPFTRLEHPATRHVSGAGLYIARKLVEAMHGHLVLQSSEGQGTSVTFTLPVARIPAQSPLHSLPAIF